VVCGDNPHLVSRARRVAGRLGISARIIGFERQMPARFAEADVVVTKPGGLTVSECLAAGRPLVLVGAVPGQETLNQDWVVSEGAGIACRPAAVGRTIENLRDRELISSMAGHSRRLGVPYAADRVIDVALSPCITNESQIARQVS
jgi:processive 1,2-diacylglycerol beta-glucosyltransferase